jgi:hypothetical protein
MKTNKVPKIVTTRAWDFIFRTAAETFVLNRYRVKAKLFEMMQTDKDFTQEDEERLNPTHQVQMQLIFYFVKISLQLFHLSIIFSWGCGTFGYLNIYFSFKT